MLARSGWGMSMSKPAACCLALLLAPALAAAQPADPLVRWGTIATLAPLCGVRDQAWSFDLRRAELQRATRSRRPDDQSLGDAPGSSGAQAALSYAESEALEDFAANPPATCRPLASDPALREADAIVRAFRAQFPGT